MAEELAVEGRLAEIDSQLRVIEDFLVAAINAAARDGAMKADAFAAGLSGLRGSIASTPRNAYEASYCLGRDATLESLEQRIRLPEE